MSAGVSGEQGTGGEGGRGELGARPEGRDERLGRGWGDSSRMSISSLQAPSPLSLRLLTAAEICLKHHSNVFPVRTQKGCFGALKRTAVGSSGRAAPAGGKKTSEEEPRAEQRLGTLGH